MLVALIIALQHGWLVFTSDTLGLAGALRTQSNMHYMLGNMRFFNRPVQWWNVASNTNMYAYARCARVLFAQSLPQRALKP